MNKILASLSQPFPPDEVRQRDSGFGKKLDYVGWDSVVRRLNELVEGRWYLSIIKSNVELLPHEKNGKPQYLAQIHCTLSIDLNEPQEAAPGMAIPYSERTNRDGTGASVGSDPDDAIKTAQAEALKKASNQFGMALELWTEEGREVVSRGRAIQGGDVAAMKSEVFRLALEKGAEPNAESVAKTFNREVEELQDPAVLKEILDKETK